MYHTINLLNKHEIGLHDEVEEDTHYRNLSCNVHTYKCTALPKRDFFCNKPIAFVELSDRQCLVKIDNDIWLSLNTTKYHGEVGNQHYFYWNLNEASYFRPVNNFVITRSCILLPLLCEKGVKGKTAQVASPIYTCIADDYTEINEDGVLVKPAVMNK